MRIDKLLGEIGQTIALAMCVSLFKNEALARHIAEVSHTSLDSVRETLGDFRRCL
jgi:hypothetical protein